MIKNIYSFTALKLFTQFTTMAPLLYLYFTDISSVGSYIAVIPIMSICIEMISTEWLRLSLHKRLCEKRYVKFFLLGFIFFSVSFFCLLNYIIDDLLVFCLVSFSLYVSFVMQHLVDVASIIKRINGSDVFFKKVIFYKLLVIDFLFPLLLTLLIYFDKFYYLEILVMFLCVLVFSITLLFYILNFKKSSDLLILDKPYYIYPFVISKRLDSQSLRLGLSLSSGVVDLGLLFPVIILSRVIDVTGTFVNYLFLYNNEKLFNLINKKFYILCNVIILPFIITYFLSFIFEFYNFKGFKENIAVCLFSFSIASIYKLFSRGVLLKKTSSFYVSTRLLVYSLIKISIVYLLYDYGLLLSIIFVVYLSIEVFYENSRASLL